MRRKSILDGIPITFKAADCPWCTFDDCDLQPETQLSMLDVKCTNPECDSDFHLFELDQSCHPRSGFRAFYCQRHGTVSLFCRKCRDFHTAFQVAISAVPVRTFNHQGAKAAKAQRAALNPAKKTESTNT